MLMGKSHTRYHETQWDFLIQYRYIAMQHYFHILLKDASVKILLAALLTIASITVAHAGSALDESTRRMAGTCVAVQSARLDNGTLPIDVISKAVAAGCMPVLRTALARDSGLTTPAMSQALLREQTGDEFDISYVLEDMAANAVTWLRGPGHSHVQELRGNAPITIATAH